MEENKLFEIQDTFSNLDLTLEDGKYSFGITTRDWDGGEDLTVIDVTEEQLRKLVKVLTHELYFKNAKPCSFSIGVADMPVGIFPTTESKIEYLNATMRITDDEQEAINRILKKQKEDERKRGSQS